MHLILDTLLISFFTIYLIRLYLENNTFASVLNRTFELIEQTYRPLHRLMKKNLLILIGGLTFLAILLLWLLFQLSFWGAISSISIVYILLISFVLVLVRLAQEYQRTEFAGFISKIVSGELTDKQLFELKQAIKYYYQQKYTTRYQEDELEPSGWLMKLILFGYSLAHPVLLLNWVKVKLSQVPLISEYFEFSPHIHRYAQYQTLLKVIENYARAPHRLQVREVTVTDHCFLFEFTPTARSTVARLTRVARKVEATLKLPDESILVQDQDTTVALFVPMEVFMKVK